MAGSDGKWTKKNKIVGTPEEIIKQINESCKNDLNPLNKQEEGPVFVMGQREPIAKTSLELSRDYSSFCGVDMTISVDKKSQGKIQSISFHEHISTKIKQMTVVELLLDTFDYPFWADGLVHLWELKTVNEYGKLAEIILGSFIVNNVSWGMSIDDIIIERQYTLQSV